jgi:hypothetical protein
MHLEPSLPSVDRGQAQWAAFKRAPLDYDGSYIIATDIGIPQQSTASDLLAEALLDRLERVLVRRGVKAGRYNDDFRFTCRSWSDAVRAIEIFSEVVLSVGSGPTCAAPLSPRLSFCLLCS